MRLHFLLLGATVLTGCAVGPTFHPPVAALTPSFLGAAAIDTQAQPADWWRGFNDPLLATLIARAVASNTDIAQARARLAQSRAAAQGAGAALLPTLDATGDVTTLSQSLETPIGAVSTGLGLPRGYTQYAVGTQASWEIDLFGGLRRGREAARADLAASAASTGAVETAISAETADAYLTLRTLQARLDVAIGQERNEALLTDFVRQRVAQGVSADRELNRSAAALEGVRASMAPLRAGIAAQLNRLDVLVGEQPGSNRALLGPAAAIPLAPAPAGSAAPTELLRRRPDVIAAERRLAAANARIGVAVADYYPHVSLTGLFGVASLGTSSLFTGNAVQASGGAGVRWRLFDFGRVDAEVAQARGREAEALAAWRGAVLSAAEDVETALARLAEAKLERESLVRQVAALTTARAQAQDAYRVGVVALIDVTDADRDLLSASDRLAAVRGEESRAAVAAYRALGGGWRYDARTRDVASR
ncbi:efflux transporter outer membrane subunit [Sphingomonas glacialis]|uniref:Efflux transporter outer membrane subunit n=1 Tax=Sphingomonas glacialis TaxID=658225 RepID=A0A502G4A3_9SPHN|nr:efflux transporter outer membrane subunit [Sphingomonas glacialis]TPG56401.1 efflux transporter outer membrane subunit [Sphingomonas glacialis]